MNIMNSLCVFLAHHNHFDQAHSTLSVVSPDCITLALQSHREKQVRHKPRSSIFTGQGA